MKKRHRDQHVAEGRRREPKVLNRGNCGSRRKLAAACSSGTAQQKRLQGGPRKELAAAGRRMTHNTKTGRRREQDREIRPGRCGTRNPKGRAFGKRRWKGPECNNGMRDRGLREQLRASKQAQDGRCFLRSRGHRGVRQEGFRTRVREASNRDVERITGNEELDHVGESNPVP
jgi:hypothetical protein